MNSKTKYTDDQWRAFNAELIAGLTSGKYKRPGDFYMEKGVPGNSMWYVCQRLGLPTNYQAVAKKARKTTGKFIQFAPVETAQLEVVIDGRIKIMVPRGDIASVKQIADAFREVA